MCAEHNIQVANCTSPANYFHILRRQLLRDFRKPLILMTPKSTLRHKKNTSSIDEFINGSTFHRVLSDPIQEGEQKNIKRLILCSGKIYFELQDYIEKLKKTGIHIVRIEQLYPFPYETLTESIKNFNNCEMIWCQEEPKNMGAWVFVKNRIENVLKTINGLIDSVTNACNLCDSIGSLPKPVISHNREVFPATANPIFFALIIHLEVSK